MAFELETQYESTLSPLHYEIEHFAEEVTLTTEERLFLEDVISIVDQQTVDLLGAKANVQPFGSFAMGLSTHTSDLDLVILNVINVKSRGFKVEQRARAIKTLYKLAKSLIASKAIALKHMQVRDHTNDSWELALRFSGGCESQSADSEDGDGGRNVR